MTGWRLRGAILWLLAGLVASTAALRAGDSRAFAGPVADALPSPRTPEIARRAILPFDAVAADVYWMRTIQAYGRDRKSARSANGFGWLFPMLSLTAALDPRFTIVYRFGAVFLAEPPPSGPGRPDQAIALLQRGLRNNPGRWQFAFDAGFICYWYGTGRTGAARRERDLQSAAEWFERAAGIPRAPVWLGQLAATVRLSGGDVDGARRLLERLSSADEAWVRDVARRGLGQVEAIGDIVRLQQRLGQQASRSHRWPESPTEAAAALGTGTPAIDPAGVPYEYDARIHRFVLSRRSPLFPLPSMTGLQ